jgi:hypothetical protein
MAPTLARDGGRIARRRDDGGDGARGVVEEGRIAGERAGAGQRHVFPKFGLVAPVGDEALKMRGDRALAALRPETEVDLVEAAAAGGER